MPEYRVLLVEQNRIMMERLSSVLRTTKGFQLVSRSMDAREALGQGGMFMPNLVLLDIDTPDSGGQVREFVRAFPQAGIVCLSGQWNAQTASTVVKAGAKGYLIKPFTGDELVAAVNTFGSSGMGMVSEVLTFFSPKGKSGKTTLIANLAMALAKRSRQNVAIIDADLQFGDMAVFFNLDPQSTIREAARDIKFLSPISLNSYFMPIGERVRVLCGTKRPEFAEDVSPRDFTEIITMARSLFRYILVDVPPAFTPISVAAAEAADSTYLVAMISDGYEVRHMRRALDIFTTWDNYTERVKTLFTRVDPCTEAEQQRLTQLLQYPVHTVLPNEYLLVAAAANNGRMAMDIKPESALARGIDWLAAEICGQSKVG